MPSSTIRIITDPVTRRHGALNPYGCPDLMPSQLGWPDMKLPILYTMTWPDRASCSEITWPRLDFVKMGSLTFREPDHAKYPAMELAFAAGRAGGTMTGVLSAANEQV